jgi:hypothetical protein
VMPWLDAPFRQPLRWPAEDSGALSRISRARSAIAPARNPEMVARLDTSDASHVDRLPQH